MFTFLESNFNYCTQQGILRIYCVRINEMFVVYSFPRKQNLIYKIPVILSI